MTPMFNRLLLLGNGISLLMLAAAVAATIVLTITGVFVYLRLTGGHLRKRWFQAGREAGEHETAAMDEELTAVNEELIAANEELTAANEELLRAREGLAAANISLEAKVAERTRGLLESEKAAQALNEKLTATNEELAATNEELITTNEELADSQRQLQELVAELRIAEEKSAKLAAIVASSDDAIVGKTLEGIITSWNHGAERTFGYPESEMIGKSILTLIPADRHDEETLIINQIRAGLRVDHYETQRLTRDGRLIDVSLTISPILDKQGNIIGASKIARDISEQKRDEQRKSDFIGMASHELKTPLTSLRALIQVLQQKLEDSSDAFVPSALAKADHQVRKMTGLINGFLNVSRLQAGKLIMDKRPMDLTEMIRELIAEMELTVYGHVFIFEPGERIIVQADNEKIGSVITNLLSNAVKYSPKGKLITVRCQLMGAEVQVSVQDEGLGIREKDLPRLFERYYRINSEDTRHISGFGVGLYLSAEIIKQHGGRIWVESQYGLGSTFYFTLPLI